jgi:SecDF, P1 head subdomain
VKRLLPLALLVSLVVGCGSSHACSVGREIVLRAVPQHGETVTRAGMELAKRIMSNRVATNSVGSPTITLRGSDEIVISGSPVPKSFPKFVSVTGNLQVFDFEKDLAAPTATGGDPTPYPTLYSLLWTVRAEASRGTPEAYYLFGFKQRAKEQYPVLQGPDPTRKALLAPYRGKQPHGTTVLAVPANREVVSGGGSVSTAATRPVGRSPDGQHWYLFRIDPSSPNGPPEITGSDLNESEIEASKDPNIGQPQVTLALTRRGSKEFQDITKAEYDRGKLVAGLRGSAGQLNQRYVQHNAIVLDGRLQATPYIDYTDNALSRGIAGGSVVISNIASTRAANNLAVVLQSGSLPYRFEAVSAKRCRQ